jgi:UDP-N-acetylmuramyl pentapeptide phosphotransferase/UDP-N-acetylglucosamine-1-phosphate transferase
MSCVVFGVFNVKKSKTFAGDVGSIGSFLGLLYDKDNSRLWTIGIYSFLFCLWN